MKIAGVAMVRNEADILGITVRYHLALGFDRFFILDNGSSDDTGFVLQQLAKDKRVRWTRDEGSYLQSQLTTELAHEAFRDGADWIAPVDADEFWYAPQRDLRAILARTTAVALRVDLMNFVQRREQLTRTPDALRHMVMRVEQPVGPLERCQELVESRQIGFVEISYPKKHISRAAETLHIWKGNHHVSGVDGPIEECHTLKILHAPLRCRAMLEPKAENWRRNEGLVKPGESWHLRRFAKLREDGTLLEDWQANSYQDGALDVYGARHPLMFDPTLRDITSPWIGEPWWRRIFHMR